MNAVSLGQKKYSPDTRLDITPSFPVEYDLNGVVAVFELVNSKEEVVFRYTSGIDSNLEIIGQDVSLKLRPDAASIEENVGVSFAEVISGSTSSVVGWNLDMERGGLTEYRFQGDLKIQPTHGKL